MSQETAVPMPQGLRLKVGIAVFVFAWLLPLGVPLVAMSDLSIQWKATLSGILAIGGPEVFALLAIVILGKAGFNFIKSRAFAVLKSYGPPRRVSRARYRVGLVLFLLPLLYSYFVFYTPDMIPGYGEHRVAINLTAEGVFIVSLFVLGGDFWDKFRALFIYEAKAQFPAPKAA